MDKMQELHYNVNWKQIRQNEARDHASITEDLMGRFAEWKDTEAWILISASDEYGKPKTLWYNGTKYTSISELITMFKETL